MRLFSLCGTELILLAFHEDCQKHFTRGGTKTGSQRNAHFRLKNAKQNKAGYKNFQPKKLRLELDPIR